MKINQSIIDNENKYSSISLIRIKQKNYICGENTTY